MRFAHPLQTDRAPLLDRVLAGIKRASAPNTKPKLPITTAMLHQMRAHLGMQQRRDVLLWAMMWTATAGLLRISEFALTSINDTERTLRMQHLRLVDYDGKGYALMDSGGSASTPRIRYAVLHLDASKSDPLRTGVDVTISSSAALRTLRRYAHYCTSPTTTLATPLFHFADGRAVLRQWLMRQVC